MKSRTSFPRDMPPGPPRPPMLVRPAKSPTIAQERVLVKIATVPVMKGAEEIPVVVCTPIHVPALRRSRPQSTPSAPTFGGVLSLFCAGLPGEISRALQQLFAWGGGCRTSNSSRLETRTNE
jgi:hypothetical protein